MSRKRKVMIEDPDWIEFTKKQKKFNELIEAAEGQTKDPEQAVKEASELDCYIQKWDVDDMFKFYLSQTTTPETRGSIASLLLAQKAHQDMGRILRQRIENEVVQHSAALFCVGFCGAKLVNRVERVAVIVAWHPGADTVRLETQIRKQYFGFADAQRFLCQGQQFSYNQNPEMVFDPDVHCKNDEERAEAAGNGPEPANACLWWCETTTNEFYSKPGRRYCVCLECEISY